jgi:hypothetical protein
MGGLFGGSPTPPPTPTPPAPTPAPTIDTARQSQQSQDANAGRKGRAATILTGNQGDLSTPVTTSGTKQLLGS